MKTRLIFWMTIASILVVVLPGCATSQAVLPPQTTSPSPPSDPIVTETLAESVDQVKGLWYMQHREGAILSLNGEGNASELTYSFVWLGGDFDEPMDSGTAKFENGQLTFLTANVLCQNKGEATYEIYIVKEDGLVIGMRGKSVTADDCPDRLFLTREFLDYPDPSLISKGTERLSTSGPELFGIWYDDSGLLHQVAGDIDFSTGKSNIYLKTYYVLQDPWMRIGTNSAKYDEGMLIFRANTGFCEDVGEATYEVSVMVYNDKVIGIHPRVIGEDQCAERRDTFDNRVLGSIRP